MSSKRADAHQRDEAREQVRAAEAGDPRAVREILRALEVFLRGETPIPRCYAVFCADSFTAFLEDDEDDEDREDKEDRGAWGRLRDDHGNLLKPAEEFEALDRSQDSPVERILGLGARLSERRLRRIGMAACRAFHLAGHRTSTIEWASALTPEEGSSPRDQAIQRTGVCDAHAEVEVVVPAHRGDPRALWILLDTVALSLYRRAPIPGPIAVFCADSLQRWTEDNAAWERVERSSQGTSPPSPTSYNAIYKLARSFCRAFCLSRPQTRLKAGEIPHEPPCCPQEVDKFRQLLRHGVSRRAAQLIITGTYPTFSSRTLDEWVRLLGITSGSTDRGALAGNLLRVAARVDDEIAEGRSREDAYLEVARWLSRSLFPSFRSQWEKWAVRVLRRAEEGHRRPEELLELAKEICIARERGECLPVIPEKFLGLLREVCAEVPSSLVPDSLIAELIPAIRKAHRFALGPGDS